MNPQREEEEGASTQIISYVRDLGNGRGERSDTELRKVGRRKRRRFHFQETTVTEEEGVERHISHQKGERENKERHG